MNSSICYMLTGVLGLSLASCQKELKPNFLILISDDQRWDQLSCADDPLIPELHTPNLDKMASDGVIFQNAFITTPICAVSRASIMTGMYASTHGMNHFNTPISPNILKQSYPALLRENGYRTGIIGKWGMGVEGTDSIFDVFDAWYHQGSYFHQTDSGRIHNSEWLANRAKTFMASCSADTPFCLTVCFKSPHHPYQPDERDKDLFTGVYIPQRETDTPEDYQQMASHIMDSSLNRWCYFDERKDEPTKEDFEKNFLRCVMSLDRAIGKISQSLQDLSLNENTITIFLSDNGYLWGEHGLGGKWLLYEESIRTPIIIHDPGLSLNRRGLKLDMLSLNIDVAPTILDMAGIQVPEAMDGVSLLPFIEGKRAQKRKDFFLEHVGVIDVENPIPDSRGVRTEEWKYIHYINADPEVEEMYHVSEDPKEKENLIHDQRYADVRNQLKEIYYEYLDTLRN